MLMVGINFSNDPQHHTQISCSFFFSFPLFFHCMPSAVQVLVRLTGGPMVLHVLRLGAASMSWEVKAWSILDGGCPANRSVDGHWAPWACPARCVQVLNSEPLPTPDHCLIYAFNQFSEERLRQSQCFLAVRWLA